MTSLSVFGKDMGQNSNILVLLPIELEFGTGALISNFEFVNKFKFDNQLIKRESVIKLTSNMSQAPCNNSTIFSP